MIKINDEAIQNFWDLFFTPHTEEKKENTLASPQFVSKKDLNQNYRFVFIYRNIPIKIKVFDNHSVIYIGDDNIEKTKIEFINGETDIRAMWECKISNDGVLYGLMRGVSGHVYFFRIAEFVNDYLLNPENINLYLSAYFKVDEKITKQLNGDNYDVPLGNEIFIEYDKIDFNQDYYQKNRFAFIFWKSSTKKITMVQFELNDLITSDIHQTNFLINENIALKQGKNLPSSDFENINELGILTGDKQINPKQIRKGSIVFSTRKSENIDVTEQETDKRKYTAYTSDPQKQSYIKSIIFSRNYGPGPGYADVNNENIIKDYVWINAKEMHKTFEIIKKYIDSQPFSIDYSMDFVFKNAPNRKFSLNKQTIDQILQLYNIPNIEKNFVQLQGTYEISLSFNRWEGGFNYTPVFDLTWKVEIFLKQNHILGSRFLFNNNPLVVNKTVQIKLPRGEFRFRWADGRSFRGNWPYLSELFGAENLFGWDARLIDEQAPRADYIRLDNVVVANSYVEVFRTINIQIKRQIINQNTTAQIDVVQNIDPIEEEENFNYNVEMIENNTNDGTKPIFINPYNFVIGLKYNVDNNFHIYHFDSDNLSTTTTINRFFNAVSRRNQKLKINLINPKSITKILKNKFLVPASDYQFNKENWSITISNAAINDVFVIEYVSEIKQPEKINMPFLTTNYNFHLSKINNKNELPTSFPTIIGTAYNGQIRQNFVFNLYGEYTETIVNNKVVPKWKLYKKITGITYNTSVNFENVFGYREKNIFWIICSNHKFAKNYKFMNIYPENYEPYTFLPFNNKNYNFLLSRINVQKDNFAHSLFDSTISDITTLNNTTILTTRLKSTELNNENNNKLLIINENNKWFLEIDRIMKKEKNEIKTININIETDWINDGKINQRLSNIIAKLLNGNQNIYDKNNILYSNFLVFEFYGLYNENNQLIEKIKPIIFNGNYEIINNKLKIEINLPKDEKYKNVKYIKFYDSVYGGLLLGLLNESDYKDLKISDVKPLWIDEINLSKKPAKYIKTFEIIVDI